MNWVVAALDACRISALDLRWLQSTIKYNPSDIPRVLWSEPYVVSEAVSVGSKEGRREFGVLSRAARRNEHASLSERPCHV